MFLNQYVAQSPTFMMPLKEINFKQLNMHRASAAATILTGKVASNPSVCMITEPCTAYNKITQVPPNHVGIPDVTMSSRPRAAIFLPKDISFVHLEQLSTPDCADVLINTERGKVVLASMYLDYNKPVVQEWLLKLMDFIDTKSFPSLLSFACNAHSQLFGPDTNERGKIFEEFILTHNLHPR